MEWRQKMLFAQPPALVNQTSEGFWLSEQIKPKQQGNWVGRVIGLGIGLIFLLLFWWFFLIIGIIGVIIAGFIPSVRHHILAYFQLLPGELGFSHHPLCLGEDVQVNFRRFLKKKRKTTDLGQLRFKIYCVERVEYTKGTDTETEHRIIWESPSLSYSLPSGVDALTLSTDFTIPAHLPPSFEGKHNQIRWVASVEQTVPKIANHVYSNFTFVVDPVIVS